MMLDEIPGALERPGDCHIQIYEAEDGREVTITIPPRPLPWVVKASMMLLALNLVIMLYTGAMLFFGHQSVLFMAQIAPHDLPLPLHRWTGWLIFGWLLLESLGVLVLMTVIFPTLMQEMVRIGPEEVSRLRQWLGRRRQERIARQDVRGFHLERDPQHLMASILSIQGPQEHVVLAENASEADREWLHSVGNALLRRYGS